MIPSMKRARAAVPAAAALLMLLALMHAPSAQSTICSSIIPSGNSTLFSNTGAMNTILGISLLILLVMAMISAMLYAIGYSFRLNNLVGISKREFGEIAVTALVVFILVGAFSITGSFAPPKLVSSTGAYSSGIFLSDCNQLSAYSFTLFSYSFDLGIVQDVVQLAAGTNIALTPYNLGVSFNPFQGYLSVSNAISDLFVLAGAVAGLLIGIGVILGVFYKIMPIFLFAGIILRTLPPTRAAGGAFIGLFIGFFIVFPIMLHFILVNTPSNLSPSQLGPSPIGFGGGFINWLSNPGLTFTLWSSITSILDPSYTVEYILGVLVPSLYAVFAVVFSFIVSFDFAEIMGDFLGSPSLSTSKSLNRML